ncbi:MAG: hypothetical protein LBJ64_03620 [Deltaproteobacteria bacterium]|nr:hypothetical protein [Deltaproteobacteria bacterium]
MANFRQSSFWPEKTGRPFAARNERSDAVMPSRQTRLEDLVNDGRQANNRQQKLAFFFGDKNRFPNAKSRSMT